MEKRNDKSIMVEIIATLSLLMLSAYQSMVVAYGWNEFVLRIFDLPKVTWATVFGVALVIMLFSKGQISKDKQDRVELIITNAIMTTFIWLLMFITSLM